MHKLYNPAMNAEGGDVRTTAPSAAAVLERSMRRGARRPEVRQSISSIQCHSSQDARVNGEVAAHAHLRAIRGRLGELRQSITCFAHACAGSR